jgi:hypothetical protein
MSLYCSICTSGVPEGFNQCLACKAGFAPQLACVACRRLVPRGDATCKVCERGDREVQIRSLEITVPAMPPPTALSIVAPLAAPPALPGLPAHVSLAAPISETYRAGRFGVDAKVQVPAKDVEIMNEMAQVVVILHTLAGKMNHFQGLMESTRNCIRQCRHLATELQDEIETRRGPQG